MRFAVPQAVHQLNKDIEYGEDLDNDYSEKFDVDSSEDSDNDFLKASPMPNEPRSRQSNSEKLIPHVFPTDYNDDDGEFPCFSADEVNLDAGSSGETFNTVVVQQMLAAV